jgi:hypothetical protein
MNELQFIGEWIVERHALSIISGIISAGFWVMSATAKAEPTPARVELTYPNPHDNVDLHQYFMTVKVQSKYNSIAAFAAAVTILCQVVGW